MIETMAKISLGEFYVQAIIKDEDILDRPDSDRIFLFGYLTLIKPVQKLLWTLGHATAVLGSSSHSKEEAGKIVEMQPFYFDDYCIREYQDVYSLRSSFGKTYVDYEKHLKESGVLYQSIDNFHESMIQVFCNADLVVGHLSEQVGIDIVADDKPRCIVIKNGQCGKPTTAKLGIALVDTTHKEKPRSIFMGLVQSGLPR